MTETICEVCKEITITKIQSNGGDLCYGVTTCKCGSQLSTDFWEKQKYMKLINKYGLAPELLTEVLRDIK